MSKFIPLDAVATIALDFTDQIGRKVSVPAGGSLSVDNPAVATVELSADGGSAVVAPATTGDVTITYTNGALSAVEAITIGAPEAVAVAFDPAVTFAPVAAAV